MSFGPKAERARLRVLGGLPVALWMWKTLPLAAFAGLRVVRLDEQACSVSLPGGWRTQNPFRSTYFAAQAMAAEMSTGAPALVLLEDAKASVAMLVVGLSVTYTKKLVGEGVFTFEDVAGMKGGDRPGGRERSAAGLRGAIGGAGPLRRGGRRVRDHLVVQATQPVVSVVGFAVAGGRSQRMGRDKALLPWGETDLLGHALARLREVTHDVRILCGPSPRYEGRGAPVIVDRLADAGPIAGIAAGLEECGGRPGLFLAVDLPLVPIPLLAHLAERGGSWDAVVPVSPRGPEPLCAVYAPSCLEPILRQVAAGEKRMTSFWPDVRVLELGPLELQAFGDPEGYFRNLNTPADLT